MHVFTANALVDDLLSVYASRLGEDRVGYTHHVYRVLNFFCVLAGCGNQPPPTVIVAAVFHDLGIWTANTADYLQPSIDLAIAHSSARTDRAEDPELTALIAHHHKLRPFRGAFADTVEPFRRADLVDVSLGVIRHGIPASFIEEVKAAFPNAGFHRRLLRLVAKQCIREPLRPLPMVRW
jgi:hypothetical protein